MVRRCADWQQAVKLAGVVQACHALGDHSGPRHARQPAQQAVQQAAQHAAAATGRSRTADRVAAAGWVAGRGQRLACTREGDQERAGGQGDERAAGLEGSPTPQPAGRRGTFHASCAIGALAAAATLARGDSSLPTPLTRTGAAQGGRAGAVWCGGRAGRCLGCGCVGAAGGSAASGAGIKGMDAPAGGAVVRRCGAQLDHGRLAGGGSRAAWRACACHRRKVRG